MNCWALTEINIDIGRAEEGGEWLWVLSCRSEAFSRRQKTFNRSIHVLKVMLTVPAFPLRLVYDDKGSVILPGHLLIISIPIDAVSSAHKLCKRPLRIANISCDL